MALTLYFDKNIGTALPIALDTLKVNVAWHMMQKARVGVRGRTRLDPLFKPTEADDVWLADVGNRGWIVLSHDKKFHKPGFEPELSAIKQHGVGCFYLWGANATRLEKAKVFFRAYDRIVAAAQSTPRPFIYDVANNGQIKRVAIP